MAVLLTLRRRLIDEHGAETSAELMLIDSAVLSHYDTLRINGWIGNFAQWLEAESFRTGGSHSGSRRGNAPPGWPGRGVSYLVRWVAEVRFELTTKGL